MSRKNILQENDKKIIAILKEIREYASMHPEVNLIEKLNSPGNAPVDDEKAY
jgi:hypothetical protein